MAVDNNAVSVTTTATRLDTAAESDRPSGSALLLYNDGSVTVYVGGSAVTASGAKKGVPVLAASYGPSFQLAEDETLYAITASGTASVLVIESGV